MEVVEEETETVDLLQQQEQTEGGGASHTVWTLPLFNHSQHLKTFVNFLKLQQDQQNVFCFESEQK